MKRQFRKIIFLPANDITLTYSGHTYVPEYQTVKTKEYYFKSRWDKFFKKKSYREFETTTLTTDKLFAPENIWEAIAYCQTYGFDVILYPELNSGLGKSEIAEAFENLKSKNLVLALLDGNSTKDFLGAISHYDINPHNSMFVSREYELIENLLELFYPRNSFGKSTNLDKPLGFYFIYWNQPQKSTDGFLLQSNGSENLPLKLTRSFPLDGWLFSRKGFSFLEDKIIYIGDGNDEFIHLFIVENYNWIQQQATSKGCTFIYFPELIKNQADLDVISNYIHYCYPGVPTDFISQFESIKNTISPEEIQNLFLSYINLPAFNTPGLLRNQGSVIGHIDNEYSLFTFEQGKTAKEQFEYYFNFLRPANDHSGVFYSLVNKPKDGSVDSLFDVEAQKLTEDVIQKIDWLKKEGLNGMLAEIAYRLFNETNNKFIEKPESGKPKLNEFATPEHSCLRIEWVSKYDFQITLPDYGNRIVEMPRLPKALYYFFLQHPEGVKLNSLSDYKGDLLSIYERISNKGDKEEIVRNINRLVDPLDNSVNVNCSRIKNAFVKLMSDRLAKHYYITGWRGEPKKVNLSPGLIEIVQVF
ncbi:MAG: hypothetical protein PHP53_21540 [Prolixibacteraceae bacterium]|nr:hypothetical protein [Prolixibacteraceae bacterium]